MDPGSRIFFNFCDFCFSWTMDHALSILESFDCQGHNSLNFGPIFKILVPKHISFPRPFFFIYCTSTWHVPTWPETCPKMGPWKTKITKIKKKSYFQVPFQHFFCKNQLSISYKKIKKMEKNENIFFLHWVFGS